MGSSVLEVSDSWFGVIKVSWSSTSALNSFCLLPSLESPSSSSEQKLINRLAFPPPNASFCLACPVSLHCMCVRLWESLVFAVMFTEAEASKAFSGWKQSFGSTEDRLQNICWSRLLQRVLATFGVVRRRARAAPWRWSEVRAFWLLRPSVELLAWERTHTHTPRSNGALLLHITSTATNKPSLPRFPSALRCMQMRRNGGPASPPETSRFGSRWFDSEWIPVLVDTPDPWLPAHLMADAQRPSFHQALVQPLWIMHHAAALLGVFVKNVPS